MGLRETAYLAFGIQPLGFSLNFLKVEQVEEEEGGQSVVYWTYHTRSQNLACGRDHFL